MLFLSLSETALGLTLFMLGLRFIERGATVLAGGRASAVVKRATGNVFSAMGIGAVSTAVAQSSVAVNSLVVTLVGAGAISPLSSLAVVMGSNVGTTMTAQIVSFSFGEVNLAAIGAFLALVGFILWSFSGSVINAVGALVLGFGLVFSGIQTLSAGVEGFYSYEFFINFFTVKSPIVLLLNGFLITAVCQSSSVVSSMLVILCMGNVVTFNSAVYLMLGANIGATVSVLAFARKKGVYARQTALFNTLFNTFGAILFFIVNVLFSQALQSLFLSTSENVGRAIANFHTFFNLISAVITLPLLSPLSKFTARLERAWSQTGVGLKTDKRAKKTAVAAK